MRKFSQDVRGFFGRLARRHGMTKEQYGAVWSVEQSRSLLHAAALYHGPPLTKADLQLWDQKRGAPLTLHPTRSPSGAVHEVLMDEMQSDPQCLAEEEASLTGVRQLHVVGAFYATAAPRVGRTCPLCGSKLHPAGSWLPLGYLQQEEGVWELKEALRLFGNGRSPPVTED